MATVRMHESDALLPTATKLRLFAVVVGLCTLFVFWRVVDAVSLTAPAILIASLLIASVFRPTLILPLYRAWMALASVLGSLVTRAVLVLAFCFLIVPISLALRLSGNDPMQRVLAEGSYWRPVREARGPERYRKKF